MAKNHLKDCQIAKISVLLACYRKLISMLLRMMVTTDFRSAFLRTQKEMAKSGYKCFLIVDIFNRYGKSGSLSPRTL